MDNALPDVSQEIRDWKSIVGEWRSVSGFEGLYCVSDHGIVARLRSGKSPTKVLTPQNTPRGYQFVRLCRGNKVKTYLVHRLVYEAFKGIIPKGMQVNHVNGIKACNRLDNLEVVTPKQNIEHSFKTGLRTGRGTVKLTPSEVRQIRNLRSIGIPVKEIAKKYRVLYPIISRIANRKAWASV